MSDWKKYASLLSQTLMELNNQALTPQSQHLSGVIEKLAFHNEDTGFSVLRVKPRGRGGLATVVGLAALVRPGDHVECDGDWVNDRTHGLQFRAERISVVPPTTLEAIERYLCSGMVPGIGAHFAKRLIDAFGEAVFDVIEHQPERLAEVPGIGPKRRKQVIEAWAAQRSVRDIMLFLQSHGIGPGRAVRIYKTYGAQAIEKIRENPYRLAVDIHGIGFKIADQLALKMGIDVDSPLRARAGVRFALQELSAAGHCAARRDELIQQTQKLLSIAPQIVAAALDEEQRGGRLVAGRIEGESCVYLPHIYQAELGVAQEVARLYCGGVPWGEVDLAAALPWAAQRSGIQLAPSQLEAVRCVLNNKVAVLTGGPGVGKTTVVKTILNIVRAKGTRVMLCAPTGRAAKRLSETTGLSASTIHRMLAFDPQTGGFKHGLDAPLDADYFVVDEASMIDINLMYSLLQAIPDRAALLLVGDADQLPSVGPGAVLADFIASRRIATARLTEIFRQAASSQIVVNAHKINHGEMPVAGELKDGSDFYVVSVDTPELIFERVMQLVTERIPNRFHLDPLREIQVLTPMNKGGLGTKSLNIELQQRLNPVKDPFIERFGFRYTVGDKVIQLVNNYEKEIFNGDVGFIEYLDRANGELKINFDGRSVDYPAADLDELSLAYATTVHKSQGSEYPAVVIPLSTQHYTLLERNLLYTAITRGKRLVVLVTQPKALRIAVETLRAAARLTDLAAKLANI